MLASPPAQVDGITLALDANLRPPERPPMTVVEQLIARYQLTPHPEGGWYREVHRSTLQVTRRDGQRRSALTQILFLLEAPAVSRWHRVSQADETWQFIGGDPLELLCLPAAGGTPTITRLGFNLSDPALQPLAVVPADCWQAARCLGDWSLVSCGVGPGFSFSDFSLLADQPDARHHVQAWADLI
jgi:uncharacterized protein